MEGKYNKNAMFLKQELLKKNHKLETARAREGQNLECFSHGMTGRKQFDMATKMANVCTPF